MQLFTNSVSLQKADFAKFAQKTLQKQAKKELPAFIQQKIDAKKEKEEGKAPEAKKQDKAQDKKQNPFAKKQEPKAEYKKQEPKAEDKKQEPKAEDKKEQKKESTATAAVATKVASAPKFVKIAKLTAEDKSQLKEYWSNIFPKAYVDALIAD